MKSKEIIRVGGIAAQCGDNCHIILPRSFLGKRVFALLKEDYDKMRRQEEPKKNVQVGKFASQGNQRCSNRG